MFHGSACIVRKVTHARTGVAFAMKTLSGLVSHAQTSQILQEIALLEVCSHKNIVCLFEAFGTADEDHTVNLVLSPWAPYRLFDFVSKNDANRRQRCPWLVPGCPASDRCVFRIMYEISDAIRYLHEKGIKHKDLKPDNILLYNEWGADTVTPLITDVGVSKVPISGMKTNPDQTMYSYRAPEQDRRDLSTLHSDIWQLGCCLAELLAAARGGTAGWMCLFHSWNNDREDCSCVIAKERGPFMDALGSICLPGSEAQEIAHRVVTGMMDLCPSGRLDISMVTATFAQLTLE